MNFLTSEYVIFVLVFLILMGLSVGSFLNVCIYRLPRHESLAFPGSHCPSCMKTIKWYDNIPVLSFILLKGKCRHCGNKISVRYPLIEMLNCILWMLMFVFTESITDCIFGLLFSSILIVISAIDLEKMEIPDGLNAAVLVLAVIKLVVSLIMGNEFKGTLVDFGVGALSGSVLLYLLYLIILKLTKKEGLGGGDVKLAFACGAFLGWKEVLFGIALSAYIGLLGILIYSLIKKKMIKGNFPYGPFLSVGFLISYMFFDDILKWYMVTFL